MDERQKDRLQREVVPIQIERRSPQQRAAAAHLTLHKRGRSIIETREHLGVLARRDASVSEEPGSREIPAARRAEWLEHRVPVREAAERGGIAARSIDNSRGGAGQEIDGTPGPRCLRPHHDEEASAVFNESLEACSGCIARTDVVQNDDPRSIEKLLGERVESGDVYGEARA